MILESLEGLYLWIAFSTECSWLTRGADRKQNLEAGHFWGNALLKMTQKLNNYLSVKGKPHNQMHSLQPGNGAPYLFKGFIGINLEQCKPNGVPLSAQPVSCTLW